MTFMRARLRGKDGVAMVVVLLVGTAFGCDWFPGKDGRDLPPWPSSPTSVTRDAGSVPDAVAPPGDSYDAMCLHYCKTLEETDVLACASSGRDDASCADAASSTTTTCVDGRCAPHRVELSLCLTQCDALARFYADRCPEAGSTTDRLCPSSRVDHDATCRAGCVL
jgi:hypothetical protein